VSVGDPLPQESSPNRSGQPQPRPTTLTIANQNIGGRALPTLMMPIGVLLEFLPCPAALWSADRAECVFNSATKTLLGYCEDSFCANQDLWLERIDPRDREAFLSAWQTLERGECKISCHYRFTPQDHAGTIVLQETAELLPIGPMAKSAVLSLYQTKPTAGDQLRDDAPVRGLVHHMANSLQAIRGELDLLHLTGALPERSFENITQGIERLHDLMGELEGHSGPEPFTLPRSGAAAVAHVEKIS
jgi:nitrogen-specific signal transduction histidine kinase